MRYLAIGDIHGSFTALETLAAFVPFAPDDTLITLGDYVNRGPDSRKVLDWLVSRKRQGNLVALRGNHEIMMLCARENLLTTENWLQVGGGATLKSYTLDETYESMQSIPETHWRFLEETAPYFEIDTHFFVHANAFPEISLDAQPDFMLYWEKFNDPPPHQSGKIMVCGHTQQRSGLPRNIGHAVCIDTWAYGGGWLTCLDVKTGIYWQANQRGETRRLYLEEADGKPAAH